MKLVMQCKPNEFLLQLTQEIFLIKLVTIKSIDKMHFNFQTMKEINPLESLEFFYISPYMPDNFIRLELNKREIMPEGTAVTEKGHFVTYFSISDLIQGDFHIKWKSEDNFVINHKIYCKIVKKNVIRIDTVL